jgi:hypothetical protein
MQGAVTKQCFTPTKKGLGLGLGIGLELGLGLGLLKGYCYGEGWG